MTAKITSRQRKQIKRFLEDGLEGLNLTKEDAQCVIAQGDVLQARLKKSVRALAVDQSLEYFTSIPDAKVLAKHQQTLDKYRRLAIEWGVPTTTAVCYRVRAGFTLKTHAPKFGTCYDQFKYLQSWNFPDEPTKDCLVFWIPRLVPGSTSKTRDEQIVFLGEIRTRLELPKHHMSSFGNVALNAGLILVHYKTTNERIPLDRYWIRTDTCRAGGGRLSLGVFDGDGLYCGGWDFGGDRDGDLGVFVSGVELGS